MIELPLILVSGILGSSHCVGMCGPFAIAIGAASSNWKRNLTRQAVYGLGRIFTYGFLGACAGFGGLALTDRLGSWTRLPAILSILAGLFLLYQGLQAAGIIRRRAYTANSAGCLAASLFAGFLGDSRARSVFLAGLFTGLLPCGLVYAFVAMAASSGSVVKGLLTMIVFGAGTLPVMMATGISGAILSQKTRARLLAVAAWAVVLAGLLCVARGVGFLPAFAGAVPPGCLLCD